MRVIRHSQLKFERHPKNSKSSSTPCYVKEIFSPDIYKHIGRGFLFLFLSTIEKNLLLVVEIVIVKYHFLKLWLVILYDVIYSCLCLPFEDFFHQNILEIEFETLIIDPNLKIITAVVNQINTPIELPFAVGT